jgi:hypothetical protein
MFKNIAILNSYEKLVKEINLREFEKNIHALKRYYLIETGFSSEEKTKFYNMITKLNTCFMGLTSDVWDATIKQNHMIKCWKFRKGHMRLTKELKEQMERDLEGDIFKNDKDLRTSLYKGPESITPSSLSEVANNQDSAILLKAKIYDELTDLFNIRYSAHYISDQLAAYRLSLKAARHVMNALFGVVEEYSKKAEIKEIINYIDSFLGEQNNSGPEGIENFEVESMNFNALIQNMWDIYLPIINHSLQLNEDIKVFITLIDKTHQKLFSDAKNFKEKYYPIYEILSVKLDNPENIKALTVENNEKGKLLDFKLLKKTKTIGGIRDFEEVNDDKIILDSLIKLDDAELKSNIKENYKGNDIYNSNKQTKDLNLQGFFNHVDELGSLKLKKKLKKNLERLFGVLKKRSKEKQHVYLTEELAKIKKLEAELDTVKKESSSLKKLKSSIIEQLAYYKFKSEKVNLGKYFNYYSNFTSMFKVVLEELIDLFNKTIKFNGEYEKGIPLSEILHFKISDELAAGVEEKPYVIDLSLFKENGNVAFLALNFKVDNAGYETLKPALMNIQLAILKYQFCFGNNTNNSGHDFVYYDYTKAKAKKNSFKVNENKVVIFSYLEEFNGNNRLKLY